MDTAIIAAIISGVCAIIAAVIAVLLQKKGNKEEIPEKPSKEITVKGDAAVGKEARLVKQTGGGTYIEKVVINQTPPPTQEKPTLPPEIPLPPTPYFAHPYPLQPNFTGRLREREELTNWFTNNNSQPIFAYIAIGGMGKSALTWYWLQEDVIKKGSAPQGIIWWSFYDREARFESFLSKAIQYASYGEIDPKEIGSARDMMDTLKNLLYNNRFLLVLDGVERVLRAYAGLGSPYQGDEVKEDERGDFRACIDPNVGIFLQWLASTNSQTKVLLTSRLFPKELDDIAGCLRKDLMEMDKEDAVEFFKRQGVKGARHEIEMACKPFGYHPLSLRLLSGMIVEDAQYPGDIKTWMEYNPLPELTGIKEKHNILEIAYNALEKKKQEFISKLSAFRSPMDYDAIAIFNTFGDKKEFGKVLRELVNRGLLLHNKEENRYDMHPIVRSYCYDKLKGKDAVHSQLQDYFANIPEPEKVESLDDLAPVIELYHHTVRAGRYDEACDLFYERINKPTYYQFGAYNLRIELLQALFPDGEDRPPRLKKEAYQAWTLNALANSYSLSGQPQKAVVLLKMANEIDERQKNKKGVAIGLNNLAYQQIATGDLEVAKSNLGCSIKLFQEIKDEFGEAAGHQQLGRLLAYQGKFLESEKELAKSTRYCEKTDDKQGLCLDEAYRAIRSLLIEDADKALNEAKRAYDIAFSRQNEMDKIRTEWLLGAAFLAKQDLKQAEIHLNEALVRDRRINLVELEPDILLSLAKLRFAQRHKEEAERLAKEALGIADRCGYRLAQADIHNFLAEYYLDSNDLVKAKEHLEIAKERASCGYQPALNKANQLTQLIVSNKT